VSTSFGQKESQITRTTGPCDAEAAAVLVGREQIVRRLGTARRLWLGSTSAVNTTAPGTMASTATDNLVENTDVGARAPGDIQQGVYAQPVLRPDRESVRRLRHDPDEQTCSGRIQHPRGVGSDRAVGRS
jgi:hypothetical protein